MSEPVRPYADAFDSYWRVGWRGVLPVQGKHPPVTGYTGENGATPSYPDCMAWSEDKGHWNIGLRLPPWVLGIDVDEYGGKHGLATLYACEMAWGALPPTAISTSRTDGSGIRFFTVPEGLSWPGQLPGGGVELVQYGHRYAMVWPSVHPEGREYRWVGTPGVPAPTDFPPLPDGWVQGLSRGSHNADPQERQSDAWAWVRNLPGAQEVPCRVLAFAAQQGSQELAVASSRHDTFNHHVLNLVRLGEQGHVGVVRVLEQLCAQFVAIVTTTDTNRRTEGAARGEVLRSLEGAVARVAGLPTFPPAERDPCQGWVTPPTPGQAASGAPGPVQDTDPRVLYRLEQLRVDQQARALLASEASPATFVEPTGLADYLDEPEDMTVQRIGGLLPNGSRVVLAAAMKSGKTTFVVNLARSLLDGSPFLGRFSVRPVQRLGWIDFEMHTNTLRHWIKDAGIANSGAAWVMPLIGRVHEFDIRLPRVYDHWLKVCAGTDVLIIDCLKPILDTLGLDENHDTGLFTTPLTRLKEEAGIGELILVHHMGHFGERSRGDSSLRGWPEVEWHLLRQRTEDGTETDSPERFFRAYGRDVSIDETRLTYVHASRSLSLGNGNRKESRLEQKADRQRAQVLEIVRTNPGINTSGVERQMTGQKGDEGPALRSLEQAKMIFKVLDGKAHRWFISPSPPVSPENSEGTSPTPLIEGGVHRDDLFSLDPPEE